MNAPLQHRIEQFLYRACELCDAQDWDAYLALFDEQCEFHLPQWDSEHVYTRDPKREMSLIYYASRAGLEDRVFRIRTGKAASTVPMPRTLHSISNVRIAEQADGQLEAYDIRISKNLPLHRINPPYRRVKDRQPLPLCRPPRLPP